MYGTFTCLKFISDMVGMLQEMVDQKAYLALELTERFVTCTCIVKKMTVLLWLGQPRC